MSIKPERNFPFSVTRWWRHCQLCVRQQEQEIVCLHVQTPFSLSLNPRGAWSLFPSESRGIGGRGGGEKRGFWWGRDGERGRLVDVSRDAVSPGRGWGLGVLHIYLIYRCFGYFPGVWTGLGLLGGRFAQRWDEVWGVMGIIRSKRKEGSKCQFGSEFWSYTIGLFLFCRLHFRFWGHVYCPLPPSFLSRLPVLRCLHLLTCTSLVATKHLKAEENKRLKCGPSLKL